MANFFDKSGRFRSRTASYKWPRTDDDPDNFFDLSRDFPQLTLPPPPAVDVGGIKSLLIDNSKIAGEVAAIAAAEDCDPRVRVLADAWSGLFKLLEAALEKAVFPMGDPSFMAAAPLPPPRLPNLLIPVGSLGPHWRAPTNSRCSSTQIWAPVRSRTKVTWLRPSRPLSRASPSKPLRKIRRTALRP